jgi:hypothetical protein
VKDVDLGKIRGNATGGDGLPIEEEKDDEKLDLDKKDIENAFLIDPLVNHL